MKPLKSKKYKALMSDVDGTVIKYDYNALPTEKVTEAIKKAQEILPICLVSGRSLISLRPILDQLDIRSGYVVTNNGAVVHDFRNNNVIYDKPMNTEETREIITILNKYKIEFYLKQNHDDSGVLNGFFKDNSLPIKSYMAFTDDIYDSAIIDSAISDLSSIPTLSINKSRHKLPNKFGLSITHAEATKLHGIQILLEKLKLKSEEIIGIGDGYNDFPLLMACGLKVAMGNAPDDLKAIADYVAPSVNDDGVADVIERFVLND